MNRMIAGALMALALPAMLLAQSATGGTAAAPSGDAGHHPCPLSEKQGKLHQELAALDARLDGLVAAMNRAKGEARIDAMAALLTEMAAQRKTLREKLEGMGHGMHAGCCDGMKSDCCGDMKEGCCADMKADCCKEGKADCCKGMKADCCKDAKAGCCKEMKADCCKDMKADCCTDMKADCCKDKQACCGDGMAGCCGGGNGAPCPLKKAHSPAASLPDQPARH